MTKHPLPEFLTQSEKEMLYNRADNPRDRALISLGLNAGLRVSEIINLKLSDIDWESLRIRFVAKGGRERIIPVNTRLRLDLSLALEHRPAGLQHEFVIWNKRNPVRHITRFAAYNLIRRHGRRAGLKRPIHPHMLRHTAAMDYYNASHDIYETQRFLGHRRLDTTTRYAQVDDMAISATLNRVNRPPWFLRLLAQFRSFPPYWLLSRPAGKSALYSGGTIGRQKEFALLKQNLEHGQSTVVVADRGLGKSHLLRLLEAENLYRLDAFRPPREALFNLCLQLKERGAITELPKGRGTSPFVEVLRQIGRDQRPVLIIDDLSTITTAGIIELRRLKETWPIIAGLDSRYRLRATEVFFGSHDVLDLLPLTRTEARQLAVEASQDLDLADKSGFLLDVVNQARGNPQAILDMVERARRTRTGNAEHAGLHRTLPATPFLSLFLLWAVVSRYVASSVGHPDFKILIILAIVILSLTIVLDRILVRGERL